MVQRLAAVVAAALVGVLGLTTVAGDAIASEVSHPVPAELPTPGMRGVHSAAVRTAVKIPGDVIRPHAARVQGMRIVRAHGCRDAEYLAAAMGDLWDAALGTDTAWADDRRFLAVVKRPTKALTQKCGREFAYEVLSKMNVFDQTWRTLGVIVDCTRPGVEDPDFCRTFGPWV